jgi:opacity protein-like surface antigen
MKSLILAVLLVTSAVLASLAPASAQTSVTLFPAADNYVDSKYPNLGRYGRVSALYVGNSYDHAQGLWGSERIYIRFDLPSLPKHRLIAHATLVLWQYNPPKSNQTYEAHRVLGDWNETTQNWDSQPAWSPTKTSEAVATTRGAQGAEVTVEWDVTSDVKAWYTGGAVNYGIMIKVAKEEHAEDASSGFWSREYPEESVKPRLNLVLQPEPGLSYVVTVGVEGLPNGTSSTMTVDGQTYGSLYPGRVENITFDRGTAHMIAVSGFISGPQEVRYRCESNETRVSVDTSHVFVYSAEYFVTFSAEPSNLFQTPPTGWYADNATLTVNRTGPDLINTAPGARLVFDAWYMNSQRLMAEPTRVVVRGPITLQGRYRTEYYLNVTSPIGKTAGSGWYAKDSVASFSVDRSAAPPEGYLGLLGLKRQFMQWRGSGNFMGLPVETQGSLIMKEPTLIEAVWQDDYSAVILNITVLLLVIVILCAGMIVTTRKRRSRRGSRGQFLRALRRHESMYQLSISRLPRYEKNSSLRSE